MTLADFEPLIQQTIRDLESPAALESIRVDPYWPKWNSPWWKMTTLHELGLAHRIPEGVVRAMVSEHHSHYLTIFPIQPGELPEGVNPITETGCHCMLGNMSQTLWACGVNVDREIPWIPAWFTRYQMADGGMNCSNDAYLQEPVPSSMVATIAPLEAVLRKPAPLSSEETAFLDRGAHLMIERELRLGSQSPHNAEEREDEADWLLPCFPRFYFYDVLRGLSFILEWAEKRRKPLPYAQIRTVVEHLRNSFPDGQVRLLRRSFDGVATRMLMPSGKWERTEASRFPLQEAVSQIGSVSPILTRDWELAQGRLFRLEEQRLLS